MHLSPAFSHVFTPPRPLRAPGSSRRVGFAQNPQPERGPMLDVLVVGAGTAGISAAHELAGHGLKVRLLEAEARPGGHAASENTQGVLHPNGPSILNVFGERFRRVIDRLGIALDRYSLGEDRLPLRDGEGRIARWVDLDQLPADAAAGLAQFKNWLDEAVRHKLHAPETPLQEVPEAQLGFDAQPFAQYLQGLHPMLGDYLSAVCHSDFGRGPEAVSAQAALSDLCLDTGDKRYLLPGGNLFLLDRLLAAFRERGGQLDTNVRVTSLQQDRDQVSATYTRGFQRPQTVTARYAVCAIPYTALAGILGDSLDETFKNTADRLRAGKPPYTLLSTALTALPEGIVPRRFHWPGDPLLSDFVVSQDVPGGPAVLTGYIPGYQPKKDSLGRVFGTLTRLVPGFPDLLNREARLVERHFAKGEEGMVSPGPGDMRLLAALPRTVGARVHLAQADGAGLPLTGAAFYQGVNAADRVVKALQAEGAYPGNSFSGARQV